MTNEPARRPVRRRRKIIGAVLAVLLAVVTVLTVHLFIAPDLPPVPAHADAIIELGGFGGRDAAALALARAHAAPIVIVSTYPALAHPGACLPPVTGVQLICTYVTPNTTRGEAEYIGRLARQYHWKSIILVTTPDQAWRARLRVSRCFDGAIYVSKAHLPGPAWVFQIPYQWAATVKAETYQRSC